MHVSVGIADSAFADEISFISTAAQFIVVNTSKKSPVFWCANSVRL
jgi:hypothetical protein